MGRPKIKESVPISFRFNKALADQLDGYSEKSMIAKTRIVERAVEEYLKKVGYTQEASNESQVEQHYV